MNINLGGVKLPKSERLFEMLQLIVDSPGKLKVDVLAKCLKVNKRTISRYMFTLSAANIAVRFSGKGYVLSESEEYWLRFLTKYRKNRRRSKESLTNLLTIAVNTTENKILSRQGKEFLELLSDADIM